MDTTRNILKELELSAAEKAFKAAGIKWLTAEQAKRVPEEVRPFVVARSGWLPYRWVRMLNYRADQSDNLAAATKYRHAAALLRGQKYVA